MIPIKLEPFTAEILKKGRTIVYFPYWSRVAYPFQVGQVYFLQERFAFKSDKSIVYFHDQPGFHPGRDGWINEGFMKDYRSRAVLKLKSSRKCRFGELTVGEFMKGIEYELDDIMIVFEFEVELK
jgi:hypothetical protein